MDHPQGVIQMEHANTKLRLFHLSFSQHSTVEWLVMILLWAIPHGQHPVPVTSLSPAPSPPSTGCGLGGELCQDC